MGIGLMHRATNENEASRFLDTFALRAEVACTTLRDGIKPDLRFPTIGFQVACEAKSDGGGAM